MAHRQSLAAAILVRLCRGAPDTQLRKGSDILLKMAFSSARMVLLCRLRAQEAKLSHVATAAKRAPCKSGRYSLASKCSAKKARQRLRIDPESKRRRIPGISETSRI